MSSDAGKLRFYLQSSSTEIAQINQAMLDGFNSFVLLNEAPNEPSLFNVPNEFRQGSITCFYKATVDGEAKNELIIKTIGVPHEKTAETAEPEKPEEPKKIEEPKKHESIDKGCVSGENATKYFKDNKPLDKGQYFFVFKDAIAKESKTLEEFKNHKDFDAIPKSEYLEKIRGNTFVNKIINEKYTFEEDEYTEIKMCYYMNEDAIVTLPGIMFKHPKDEYKDPKCPDSEALLEGLQESFKRNEGNLDFVFTDPLAEKDGHEFYFTHSAERAQDLKNIIPKIRILHSQEYDPAYNSYRHSDFPPLNARHCSYTWRSRYNWSNGQLNTSTLMHFTGVPKGTPKPTALKQPPTLAEISAEISMDNELAAEKLQSIRDRLAQQPD